MKNSKSFILIISCLSLMILFLQCEKEEDNTNDDNNQIEIVTGTVKTDGFISSEILDRDMNYSIYLPPSYNDTDSVFPVLYLLHGMWGTYLDWVSNGMASVMNSLIISEESVEMIVVMPNGIDAFYCNDYNGGGILYEDFMIQEFIPQIESTYRINSTKEGRAIAGLSMGGYGASFHAFKRTEMYSSCYSMSGALEMGDAAPDLQEIINAKSSEELNALPAYTMECGTEDYLVFSSNESFNSFLNEKEIEHDYITRTGAHDWTFWMACLPKVLRFVSQYFE